MATDKETGYMSCDACGEAMESYIFGTCKKCGADVHNKCFDKKDGKWYCPICHTET